MFLHKLNRAEQKNFLELAHYIANVDLHLDPDEEMALDKFRAEMDLSNEQYAIRKYEMETILENLKSSSHENKQIMLLEAILLIECDGILDPREEEILEKLLSAWNISKEKCEKMMEWSKEKLKVDEMAMTLIE